jgi:hypothetical protein
MATVVTENIILLNINTRLILTIGTRDNELRSDNIYSFLEECEFAQTHDHK